MLPPYIIEQIRRREEELHRRQYEQPQIEMLSPSVISHAEKQAASGAIDRRNPTGSEAICLTVPCPSTRPVNMFFSLFATNLTLLRSGSATNSPEHPCGTSGYWFLTPF